MSDCLFCGIVAGTAPAHLIWENRDYLAFLSIYPNTPGASVVIPRGHWPSYIAAVPTEVAHGLHDAAVTVAALLDAAFDDVARTAMVFEGYGIDHLHAKLFPLHGTAGNDGTDWQPIHSPIDDWIPEYQGYVSSHDSRRANDTELAAVADTITAAQPDQLNMT